MKSKSEHIPVLVKEVVDALQVRPSMRYVDCTVGQGGHATAILEKGALLLGLDLDPDAIEAARSRLHRYGERAILINKDFASLKQACLETGFHPAYGILFDLGMSSLQLDDPTRGFSFQHDAPLNMRYNPSQELTAATIVNTYPEDELAGIIAKYGEEHRSRRLARAIVASRPITSTSQLAAVVEKSLGARRRIHPATRTFQALRIMVNQELQRLEAALNQVKDVLAQGGRLVVISFHSLEDRLVKNYMMRESRDCICPPRTPVCICGHRASLRLVTRKATTPSPEEIVANPRSRSARMRVAERT